MTDYKSRIKSINDKMNKLKEEETKLVESRKYFFGNLLKRLELLDTSDATLTGLLFDFKQNLSTNPQLLMGFEKAGEDFIRSKKKSFSFTTDIQASLPVTSIEAAIE